MGWTAHGTGSQRESSGCTAGLPLRLAMVAAVAVIIVMPSQSAAQEPPETPPAAFQDLPLLVNLGDRIAVTNDIGRELQGDLVDISPSALSALVAGTRYDLQESQYTVSRQRRQDSVKNGALLGLLVGAGSAAVVLASSDDYIYPVQWALTPVAMGGVGLSIGVARRFHDYQVDVDLQQEKVRPWRLRRAAALPRQQGRRHIVGFSDRQLRSFATRVGLDSGRFADLGATRGAATGCEGLP